MEAPRRATRGSAGYDLFCPRTTVVPRHGVVRIDMGICVLLEEKQFLQLKRRSSTCMTYTIHEGVIDSDYFPRPVVLMLKNLCCHDITLHKGERIAQALLLAYVCTSDDCPRSDYRSGGLGSTGT